jgi:hypothetical protein
MAFRLVSMPEEQAAPVQQPKRYRLVASPEGQTVNAGGKADRSMSGGEMAADVAKSGGIGLAQGAIGLAGLPGDAREFAAGAAGWLGGETAAGATRAAFNAVPGLSNMPTSSQIKGGIEGVTGEFYQPKSTAGEYARTIGEFAPAAVAGPGGLVRKAAMTVIPAVASEGAGQATNGTAFEPAARFAGALAGGVASAGRAGAQAVNGAKLVDEARAAKTAAYQAAEQAGVRYSPQAFDGLVNDIGTAMAQGGVNQMRHPRAVSMYQDINGLRGKAPSLTELDQIRQTIARDVAGATDQAERHFGKLMMGKIDEFIDAADQTMVSAGDPQQAAGLIRAAREANQRYRKLETVTNAVTKAERRAASTGSGGNADNQIRQNIRGIMDSERKSRGFSKAELGKMDDVVRGSKTQNAVRLAGKLSPQGNGLMAALGIGGAMTNPVLGVPALVGAAAKPLAERMTRKKVDALIEALAGKAPQANPDRRKALARALLAGESGSLAARE